MRIGNEYLNRWAVSPRELEKIPLDQRTVGYVRVSEVGGRGDDLISPELQEHSIDTFCAREGLTVVYWIYDIDKSGRSFSKRQVDIVAQGVKDGTWKVCVLWKWSRWGRNMRESLVYLARIEDEVGGVVRAATEDFDPRTSVGRFSRNQMLLIAELQSDMISDGWKETHAKRRRDGLPHTAAPRWGYLYDKGTGYLPDPETAPILKDAYERYVAGTGHRSLALEWNARGLRTTHKQLWSQESIARMMDTGFAAALIRERSNPPTASESGGSKGRAIWAFDVWRQGQHEAIISAELWEKYRKRRLDQALMAPRLRTAAHELSGLMRCGWEGCAAPMVSAYSGKFKRHSWVCYRARNRKEHPFNSISNQRAVADIRAWVVAQATGGEDVTERARRMAAAEQAHGEVTRLKAESERLARRISRLVDLYMDEELTREEYQAKKRAIEIEGAKVDELLATAHARETAAGQHVIGAFGALADEWDRLPPELLREALSKLVKHIIVLPGPYVPGEKLKPVPRWEY